MKTRFLTCIAIVAAAILIGPYRGRAGDLNPSGPPRRGTMKTLDEVEPRIPIPGSQSPAAVYVIDSPGSYYLTGNRAASGSGIEIISDNVTLDLMGYTLSGPGPETDTWGIRITEGTNIAIHNGTVTTFGRDGIQATINVIRATNVRAVANRTGIAFLGAHCEIRDCIATNNRGHGLDSSTRVMIIGCTSVENEEEGIRVGNYSIVQSNTVRGNGGHGINASAYNRITDNIVAENGGNGMYITAANVITGNAVSSNALDGIYTIFDGCVIRGNTVRRNGDDGIKVVDGCTIQDNIVQLNEDYGIYAENGTTMIGNTAFDQVNDYGLRAGNGSTVKDNTAYGNYRGMYIRQGCTVIGNTAYNNETWGIYVHSQSLVADNTAFNNVTAGGAELNLRTDATCTAVRNHAPAP